MKTELCLRWLHNNGWTPQDPCACGKPDYDSQILRHCQGCAEVIDCDNDDPENWCGPCWDHHQQIIVEQERDALKVALGKMLKWALVETVPMHAADEYERDLAETSKLLGDDYSSNHTEKKP